eukprot:jgi/Botrbrau1/15279/Bobra.97_1s0005.1
MQRHILDVLRGCSVTCWKSQGGSVLHLHIPRTSFVPFCVFQWDPVSHLGYFMVPVIHFAWVGQVDAPRIFSGMWQMLQPVIDPHTRQKITFLPYDLELKGKKAGQSKLEAELARLLDQDTVRWLLVEMAQNRNKSLTHQKFYPYGKVHAVDDAEAKICSHDVRGTHRMIHAVASAPSLLVPTEPLHQQ